MSGQLIDAVYQTLKHDETFMALLGLTPTSSPDDVTRRIIRGMEPEKTLTGNSVPQVMIYEKPGRYSRNYLVYEGKFCLDVYAENSAKTREISESAFSLFHDRNIEAAGFRSYPCFLTYSSDFATGITGVKGFESIFDVDYVRATKAR